MYAIPNPRSYVNKLFKYRPAAEKKDQAIGETDKKRAVLSVPFRGSLTVEAALAFPLFIGAVLLMLSLFRVMAVCEQVDSYLCTAGRRAAAYSESCGGSSLAQLYALYYMGLPESGIETDRIVGGAPGIILGLSRDSDTDIIELTAHYTVRAPGYFLPDRNVAVSDKIYVRAWVGGKPEGAAGSQVSFGDLVYVADNGVVYHRSDNCTHLMLSVQQVPASSVADLRNDYGAKYYPCEHCGASAAGSVVYITDSGRAWHTDRMCSGLKRRYRTMTEDEAVSLGLRACSRCGG